MLRARRQLTRKTLVWCGDASNAVIAGRLICEKQGAAGRCHIGHEIDSNESNRGPRLAHGTRTMTRVSRAIDRSTGFLWLV